MSCGHSIAPSTLVEFLMNLVDTHRSVIKCPVIMDQEVEDQDQDEENPIDEMCLTEWDFDYCEKAGIMTESERKYIELGIKKNHEIYEKKARVCETCGDGFYYKPPGS